MSDKLSLKDSLAGLRQSQAEPRQIDLEEVTSKPVRSPHTIIQTEDQMRKDYGMPALKKAKAKAASNRVPGKSKNPDFEKVGVYVRTETRRKAERKWQDQSGGDLSELIETLLSKFVGA